MEEIEEIEEISIFYKFKKIQKNWEKLKFFEIYGISHSNKNEEKLKKIEKNWDFLKISATFSIQSLRNPIEIHCKHRTYTGSYRR